MIFTDDEIVEDAFIYFRKNGFPYRKLPVHVCKQEINKLSQLEDTKLWSATLGYKVADTYHPERFHTPALGMKSPFEGFQDDRKLYKAIKRRLEFGGGVATDLLGGVGGIAITSGVQGASNFRPGVACAIYRKYAKPDANVLDTSCGFGGRLVGFIASKAQGTYLGIDPNSTVIKNNRRMCEDLGFTRAQFVNVPVEDLRFQEFAAKFDFSFTSPPYFHKELYQGENQSWARYGTSSEWKEKFLSSMLQFQFNALVKESFNVVVVADIKIKNELIPLVDWTETIAKETGFTLYETFPMKLAKRLGKGHEEAEISSETVLVFKK